MPLPPLLVQLLVLPPFLLPPLPPHRKLIRKPDVFPDSDKCLLLSDSRLQQRYVLIYDVFQRHVLQCHVLIRRGQPGKQRSFFRCRYRLFVSFGS